MPSEDSAVAIQLLGCMVDALADETGKIDPQCFEKICNACVRAVLISMKVGDKAAVILKRILQQVLQFYS